MCFPVSPGETHKQFDPHPFPGQSSALVYVYWLLSFPTRNGCSKNQAFSGHFTGQILVANALNPSLTGPGPFFTSESLGLAGSLLGLPKGPSHTKNTTAMHVVTL